MLRKTINIVEKETPRPSKFIADSSPFGNKAGMRETKSHTEALVLCGENPVRGIAWGWD
jgi:hypothetical protein